jgi:carbonic anhydrase
MKTEIKTTTETRPPLSHNGAPTHAQAASITSAEALQRLVDGNRRFVTGNAAQHPTTADCLARLAEAQHPFATVLGCSDSRVMPELVFDQYLGDLFVVRVAGNVVGAEVLGSLAYAVQHLRTPLFVVLGHEGCGAVQAALEARIRGPSEPLKIRELLEIMMPGLEGIPLGQPREAQMKLAVEANVLWAASQLMRTAGGQAALAEGTIQIVGAVYELATGKVRFLNGDPYEKDE